MFEVFSGSYYLGRLYVTPTNAESAFMHSDQHERINEEVYATGHGVERLDAPLVMKLENRHFPVHGDDAVPSDTLAVPETMLEETRIRNPPSLREVFLARRERARQLLEFAGGWQPSGDDSDATTGSSSDDYPNAGT
ncbi:hypothetical protein EA462_06790 [Natrarchaeobius halalkaliphilus]|uniref:Uncharacterized protein n=1 Tax=Natrarchaeobius halalkaliphilus TaxID=1679091 RepID=A0A3N6P258_9EURY|nr:DUF5802 family protein [Natrarchaeobius halalkaliphilus]RQG91649.1 hypothetical protein EA462_06790 [Natrarchaeobius halalkaliphilus]